MTKKVITVGSCAGIKDILVARDYIVEDVDQKRVLDVLRKEAIEAVIIDLDDTSRPTVVIGGIRHLYPGLWIIALTDGSDNKSIPLVLKSGASNYITKPVSENELVKSLEEREFSDIEPFGAKTGDNGLIDGQKRTLPVRFYNAFFVTEYGKLETLRADRYNKTFSVVLTHIEGFPDLKKKLEKKELLDFIKELIKTMMGVLRNCDVIGMVEDKKLITLLPETDYFGSIITLRKLRKAVESLNLQKEQRASIIFSNASYPRDGNGYGELVGIVEKRIVEQREGAWRTLGLENKSFWEIVSMLISEHKTDEKDAAPFDLGKGLDLPVFFLDRLQEMILQEISRNPKKKGIMYLGLRKLSPSLPILKAIDTIGMTATKIYIVGEGDQKKWNIPNAAPIYLSDSRIGETFFTLFFTEDISYAVLCKERWGEQYSCFHTADPYLTEGLIGKFQKEYSLQEQL